MNTGNRTACSQEEVQTCISILEHLVSNTKDLACLTKKQRIALMSAAGRLSRPDKEELHRRTREKKKTDRKQIVHKERHARAGTGIRRAREATVFAAPKQITENPAPQDQEIRELNSPRNCYVCKAEFTRLHFFYDAMCMDCAEFNYKKRFQTAPLHGQVALITGSRLKIGYQATLMMLRAGARVIATTRFPVDSAVRYAKETDYADWSDRLHIYGLDLRHTPSVELFCSYIVQQYDRLDILVNNAAQTVRRPPAFYAHLMTNEALLPGDLPCEVRQLLSHYQTCKDRIAAQSLPKPHTESDLAITWTGKTPGIGLRASAQLSQVPYAYDHALATDEVFPKGELDADLQQVDLRTVNSWRLRLGDIDTSEMLELQLVNAVAPFVLCNRLTAMMKRDNTGQKHMVNVSAMEGKFFRFKKDDRHPHTNMAKAALNMLTHTSASDLAKSGIFMNAVDTGWVTDEDPAALSQLKQDLHDFQPPLDIVDGAARVCDPFFHGILTGRHWSGKFLKDYHPIDW
ncbi:MAG: SDR family oxidoreductase [Phycisphaerae bacterium]|nr:SDR family oxidoreductase [Phycisphaerae bacterium]